MREQPGDKLLSVFSIGLGYEAIVSCLRTKMPLQTDLNPQPHVWVQRVLVIHYAMTTFRSCHGTVDTAMVSCPKKNPSPHPLTTAAAPFGKALYSHPLVPRRGLKAFAFSKCRWPFYSGHFILIQSKSKGHHKVMIPCRWAELNCWHKANWCLQYGKSFFLTGHTEVKCWYRSENTWQSL